ncbi:hypothetical protein FRB90_003888, partial [Tulasnella sp. 427]
GSNCQVQSWKAHKSVCKQSKVKAQSGSQKSPSDIPPTSSQTCPSDRFVKAVKLKGRLNKNFNAEELEIPSDHELFVSKGLAERISPISQLVDVPIIVWRLRKRDNFKSYLAYLDRPHLDSSSVKWLMVDPWTGQAPPLWQLGVGPVIVARKDKKPLSAAALKLISLFCEQSGGHAAEENVDRALLEARYEPAAFQKWCIDHKTAPDETLYCGSKCQAQDWKAHKSLCKQRRSEAQFKDQNVSSNASSMSPQPSGSDKVKAVHLKGGWNKPFNAEDAEIPNDHELFAVKGLTKRISPISQLVGVPIIIWRIRKDNPMSHLYSQEREHLDNSSVTWLMIDPWTGWAPPQWQQGIGPVRRI